MGLQSHLSHTGLARSVVASTPFQECITPSFGAYVEAKGCEEEELALSSAGLAWLLQPLTLLASVITAELQPWPYGGSRPAVLFVLGSSMTHNQ